MDIITDFGSVVPGSSPGGSTMREIAKRYGTPLYVYDARVIRQRAQELKEHFKGAEFHYAMKANSNAAILAILKKEGFGVEAVSPGELERAMEVGFSKEKISFTCASLTEEELVFASKSAGRVHLDSLHQLEVWGKKKLGGEVSLRLNQGIGSGHHEHVITGGPGSKFGITLKDLPKAHEIAAQYNLRIAGLQQHIGSNVLDAGVFMKAVKTLLKTSEGFPDIRHIDFGGGFGVPYSPKEKRLNLKRLGAEWKKAVKGFGNGVTFAFEPGRYLVAEAGTLLVSVVDRKETSKHMFIGVNSGMNHLLRPALYGSYHPIKNLSRTGGVRKDITIAGNICESGDLLALNRKMALPAIGDILAIQNAGAYGMTMASRYNLRELPKEILVDGTKAKNVSTPG